MESKKLEIESFVDINPESLNEKIPDSKAIVIDIGGAKTKVGFAGEKLPRLIVNTAVYFQAEGDGFLRRSDYFDDNKESTRKETIFTKTNDNSIDLDAVNFEIFLNLIYKELDVQASDFYLFVVNKLMDTSSFLNGRINVIDNCALPENAKEILRNKKLFEDSNPFDNAAALRRKMSTVVFDKLKVPKAYFSFESILALYSTGNTSGFIVDVGYNTTRLAPFYDGFLITHSLSIRDVGGKDVEKQLEDYIQNKGIALSKSVHERDIILNNIRLASENLCYVAIDPVKENEKWKTTDKFVRSFNVISDSYVNLDEIRFEAPEVLFRPEPLSVTKEPGNLAEAVIESIQKCDKDLAGYLYSNIILTGGGSKFEGFEERFTADIKEAARRLVPRDMAIKVKKAPHPVESGWIGGSIIASRSVFEKRGLWVTLSEFEEKGSSVVDRCI